MTATVVGEPPPVPATEELRPAYLVVRADAAGAYVGALLVTDGAGLPADFRYTDPITPTRLQRVLYGGVLDRNLRLDVVARTLLDATDQRPGLLLVDDRQLLDRGLADCPVALVSTGGVAPLGPVGTLQVGGDNTLVQIAEGQPPLRMALPGGDGDAGRELAAGLLVRLAATMDPLEPLARVREALDLVAAGEVASGGEAGG